VKDSKKMLDSWRIDVRSGNIYSHLLRQFDLARSDCEPNRRKVKKNHNIKSSAAILSLCFVTGLSVGVSSAFADNDIAPDVAPQEQPTQREKVDVKSPPSKYEQKVEQPSPEIVPQELQVEQRGKEDKVEVDPVEEKAKMGEMAPTDVASPAGFTPNEMVKQKQQPAREGKPTGSTVKSRQKQSRATSAPTHPQTVNGGVLPRTASNDLHGVLTGVGIALLGSLYFLPRSRMKKP
jgi:outer membrane biosynthesis protein TonB